MSGVREMQGEGTPYSSDAIRSMFLSQSWQDAWTEYQKSLHKEKFIGWDYVILTASDEEQAAGFREQIRRRLDRKCLPAGTHYAVLPDPEGKRVGSGGATLHALRYLAGQILRERDSASFSAEQAAGGAAEENASSAGAGEPGRTVPGGSVFAGKRIMIIHSGGDSKRVPQYSAIGKLFSPVPHELPDGRASTLFDEFMIGMSPVPARIRDGMLVLSGDVLLLFNALQVGEGYGDAAAISIKESVETGKDHGVFLSDGHGYVKRTLQKQSIDTLRSLGAVNDQGNVDLDTGAILLSPRLEQILYDLVRDGEEAFVNDRARVSFYGDMLYPLAADATLEQYYREKPEGEDTPELRACRTKLWDALHSCRLRLFALSPARFIHFGTTHELLRLNTTELQNYASLGWSFNTASNLPEGAAWYTAYSSYIGHRARVGAGSYVEKSYVLNGTVIGAGSIVSGCRLAGEMIPSHVVLHVLPVRRGGSTAATGYVARIYGIQDNPKGTLVRGKTEGHAAAAEDTPFLGTTLGRAADLFGDADLWGVDTPVHDLWNASLYPVCDSMQEAVSWALRIQDLLQEAEKSLSASEAVPDPAESGAGADPAGAGQGSTAADPGPLAAALRAWAAMPRMSLKESFAAADMKSILAFEDELSGCILCRRFIDALQEGQCYTEALEVFRNQPITPEIYHQLMREAQSADFSTRIRMDYAVSRYMEAEEVSYDGHSYDYVENLCFDEISRAVQEQGCREIAADACRIVRDEVTCALPLRVNFGGGWTDTPPVCNEIGGMVLNAAISVNGILPVRVCVRRLPDYQVVFESQDIGVKGTMHSLEEIQDCGNPFDSFALHKAALLACGVIPMRESGTEPQSMSGSGAGGEHQPTDGGQESLAEILRRLGGGIYLSTQVIGIPKGSGLGTSSILAGACVKALSAFLGQNRTGSGICQTVLNMEQIMSTGGGWQDQVGGLTPGFKMITTRPGLRQQIQVEPVRIPDQAMQELQERFVLIYSGQRRLARNILRDVLGRYIGGVPDAVQALHQMKDTAVLMKSALEQGDIDRFAALLDHHWELSKQLDAGSTNTWIDQIFLSASDLIDAGFVCGAGGGGFLMAILKRGVPKAALQQRLTDIFQDSGVAVWDSRFV